MPGAGHTATVRPLVLLDVDGVLNAVTASPDPAVWPDWQVGSAVAGGRAWPLHWSPSVVAAVRGWLDVADVHWLTTWGHDANDGLRELFGLPELPVAGTHPGTSHVGSPDPLPGAPGAHAQVAPAAPDALTGRWWKFDVVREIVRADPSRRLVWVDDDLSAEDDVRAWMRRESRSLLVAPHPRTGLTSTEVEAVNRYLRAD